jgi:hypothetical protein
MFVTAGMFNTDGVLSADSKFTTATVFVTYSLLDYDTIFVTSSVFDTASKFLIVSVCHM